MFSADVCLFYIVYELLIGLVFLVMYSTANSRGGVEAILFFAGWEGRQQRVHSVERGWF